MTAPGISQLPFFLTGSSTLHEGRSYSMGVSETELFPRILDANHQTDYTKPPP